MRISDWSSDVCSSDLRPDRDGLTPDGVPRPDPGARLSAGRRDGPAGRQLPQRGDPAPAQAAGVGVEARQPRDPGRAGPVRPAAAGHRGGAFALPALRAPAELVREHSGVQLAGAARQVPLVPRADFAAVPAGGTADDAARSEEHTSELQSLMRISYSVFCLKKK